METGDWSISMAVVGVAAPEAETAAEAVGDSLRLGTWVWCLRGKEKEKGDRREELLVILNGTAVEDAERDEAAMAVDIWELQQ